MVCRFRVQRRVYDGVKRRRRRWYGLVGSRASRALSYELRGEGGGERRRRLLTWLAIGKDTGRGSAALLHTGLVCGWPLWGKGSRCGAMAGVFVGVVTSCAWTRYAEAFAAARHHRPRACPDAHDRHHARYETWQFHPVIPLLPNTMLRHGKS